MPITTLYEDRIPANEGRVKITDESSGASTFAVIERADNPVVEGTKVDSKIFDEIKTAVNNNENAIATLQNSISSLQTAVTALSNRQNFTMSLSGTTLTITKV